MALLLCREKNHCFIIKVDQEYFFCIFLFIKKKKCQNRREFAEHSFKKDVRMDKENKRDVLAPKANALFQFFKES